MKVQTVVFSASIENEAAMRRWMESVQRQTQAAQTALDDLASLLHHRPHVAITLNANDSSPQDDPA